MSRTLRHALALAAASVLLTSCSAAGPDPAPAPAAEPDRRDVVTLSPPDPDAPPHTHEAALGDGTTRAAAGYRMTGLRFPAGTEEPGELSFRVVGPDGEPVLDYVEEQTKLLHLYVVRDDLGVFRHLHPDLRDDGTWTAHLHLGEPGRYRVVAEFVPSSRSDGSHVVLGAEAELLGPGESTDSTAVGTESDDGVVHVTGPDRIGVGRDEEMVLTVDDGGGGVLNLGTYLGAYAHLTGFEESTGAFVHVHPLGAPTQTDRGSELRFHTSFADPGSYRFFVQVRVDGFVHTLPLSAEVTEIAG